MSEVFIESTGIHLPIDQDINSTNFKSLGSYYLTEDFTGIPDDYFYKIIF